MEIIFLLILFFGILKFRILPANTVIIIDRDSHYLKTVHKGIYRLGSKDKITTKISEMTLSRFISDYYETYDGKTLTVSVNCTYRTQNIKNVLKNLEIVRRSLDDIIQSSIYFAIRAYSHNQIVTDSQEVKSKIYEYIADELKTISVDLENARININPLPVIGMVVFRPHVSACTGCSTTRDEETLTFNYENSGNAIKSKYDSNDSNPIKFYR